MIHSINQVLLHKIYTLHNSKQAWSRDGIIGRVGSLRKKGTKEKEEKEDKVGKEGEEKREEIVIKERFFGLSTHQPQNVTDSGFPPSPSSTPFPWTLP